MEESSSVYKRNFIHTSEALKTACWYCKQSTQSPIHKIVLMKLTQLQFKLYIIAKKSPLKFMSIFHLRIAVFRSRSVAQLGLLFLLGIQVVFIPLGQGRGSRTERKSGVSSDLANISCFLSVCFTCLSVPFCLLEV